MLQYDDPLAKRQECLWSYFGIHTREALKSLLEAFMEHERDVFLACQPFERSGRRRGYRNGFQTRWLDTTLGPLKLRKPRVRGAEGSFQTQVFGRYQRRARQIERAVNEWVACGVSTREVVRTAHTCFGIDLSAGAVSAIVARLDGVIARFHARPLAHGYRYVHLDAKHGYTCHKRKRRGRGKKKKAVLLLAWGRRHDGAEELIDFRIADSESEHSWSAFLTDLERRGLTRRNPWNQSLDLIVTDGDGGLLAALAMVYPTVPKQRCIFHKVQNIAEHLRERGHRQAILDQAGAIYHALDSRRQALSRLRAWQRQWKHLEPEAVRTFTYEFEDTLTYLNTPPHERRRLKTNNPIERFIKELNRKIKEVVIFPSAQSWERCTWLQWEKLRASRYAPTVPPKPRNLFTHIS